MSQANGTSSTSSSAGLRARALVAEAVGAPLALQEVVIDPSILRDDEVIVHFSYSGICHTDVSAIQGVLPVQFPIILGHEGAGVIEHVSANAQSKGFQVGDTVLCSFTSCDKCEQCTLAAPSRCELFFPGNFGGLRPDMTPVLAHRASDGQPIHAGFFGQSSFAERSVVSTRCLVKTQTRIPLELVCAFGCGIVTGFGTVLNMLVPSLRPRSNYSDLPGIKALGLATYSKRGEAIAAQDAAHIKKHSLVVFGAGAVGIAGICAGALARDSIDTIIAVDLVDERLGLARKAGATHTINSSGLSPDDVVEKIQKCTADGQGPRLALEATGNATVVGIAAKAMCTHGVVAIVGAGPAGKTVNIDPSMLLIKQGRMQGVIEGASDATIMVPYMLAQYEQGFSHASNGHADTSIFAVMRDLVTVYDPQDIAQALADAASGKVVKPVIRWAL